MSESNFVTDQPERVVYWKSLLKIESQVAVSLAQRAMPVDRILNLVPGVMLQFEKAFDAPLMVELDNQAIAECEVVKVGDRFGVKITQILEHPETWIPLVPANPTRSSPPLAG
ncbi:MAG: FliM/FliN family flagellar motor C-terminal domain-containing protein [Pirellulaceae bacterium]|nr:FliM/FliN family flagellar motor C-terminal domain-containing protein [Pirellulaceae bacterium]